MTIEDEPLGADIAWAKRLDELLTRYDAGDTVSPRGMPTAERLHATLPVDLRRPVVVNPTRRVSFDFMAAEARWVVTGDDRLASLEPYAPSIGQFADVDPKLQGWAANRDTQRGKIVVNDAANLKLQGTRFYGAYGPRFVEELPRVVRCLGEDPDTRQAWLTLWRTNPPPTRDVPCTIALGWTIRNGRLDCHAYMRSSDVWLGLPYDLFTFSVLTYRVGQEVAQLYGAFYELGALYLTAASSHLYERDVDGARSVFAGLFGGRCWPVDSSTGNAFDEAIEAINYRLGYHDNGVDWQFWKTDEAR